MEINSKKTKCMIFDKTGRFFRRSFKVGKEVIYTTNAYRYLGFVLTPSGEINTGHQDLMDRAIRAYYTLKNKMVRYFMICPITTSLILYIDKTHFTIQLRFLGLSKNAQK